MSLYDGSMHPDESPLRLDLYAEYQRLQASMSHVQARLVWDGADPQRELRQFAQMVALKRGSRR